MKIAVWYNLPSGGSKRALHDHLAGLKARGHTIEAWRPPIVQENYASIAALVPEHEVPLKLVAEGSRYLDRIVRHVVRSRMLVESMKRHSAAVATQINQGGFDVLFANTDMLYAMPMVGRYVTIPKAVFLGEPRRQFYEAFPEFLWMAQPSSIRRSWSPRSLVKRVRDSLDHAQFRREAREEFESAKSFDTILVNSIYSRESVLRAYGLESDVCYLGIDRNRFKNLGLERERFVVGMGTAAHPKNLILAVKVIAALPQPRPPLIWIANMSDPPYVEEVRRLATTLAVDFQLKEQIPDEEVLRLLNTATLMLYTSRLEPFGLAPLEANACALPVVGLRQGGVRETVVDGMNGLLCSESVPDLASAVAALVDQPDRARSFGTAGEEWVATHWTLEAAIDRIERALIKTAAGPTSHAVHPG